MRIYVDRIRREKGLTLLELEKMSGVSHSHIYNIENGNKVPTITVLCKLAKALDTPCDQLFSCDD